MNLSYVKLNAKNKMVKNTVQCFFTAFLPYTVIFSFTALNYYLYFFLESFDFSGIAFLSSYALYVRASLFTLSAVLSFLLYKLVRLMSDSFFFRKSSDSRARYRDVVKALKFKQYTAYVTVSVLKFFLSAAWGALYLLPAATVMGAAVYCFYRESYGANLIIALVSSAAALSVSGLFFWYVTMKRYSACSAVILSSDKPEPFKVIEKSIDMMDGHMLKYSLYSLSFFGWILSCVLLIPIVYVLPYRELSKYSFYNSVLKCGYPEKPKEKPVIFYLSKKALEQ